MPYYESILRNLKPLVSHDYESEVQYSPQDFNTHCNYISTLQKLGRLEESLLHIYHLRKASSLNPSNENESKLYQLFSDNYMYWSEEDQALLYNNLAEEAQPCDKIVLRKIDILIEKGLFKRALSLLNEIDSSKFEQSLDFLRIKVLIKNNSLETSDSLKLIEDFEAKTDTQSDPLIEGTLLKLKSQCHIFKRQYDDAEDFLLKAIEIFETEALLPYLGRCYLLYGELSKGNIFRGREHPAFYLAKAFNIFSALGDKKLLFKTQQLFKKYGRRAYDSLSESMIATKMEEIMSDRYALQRDLFYQISKIETTFFTMMGKIDSSKESSSLHGHIKDLSENINSIRHLIKTQGKEIEQKERKSLEAVHRLVLDYERFQKLLSSLENLSREKSFSQFTEMVPDLVKKLVQTDCVVLFQGDRIDFLEATGDTELIEKDYAGLEELQKALDSKEPRLINEEEESKLRQHDKSIVKFKEIALPLMDGKSTLGLLFIKNSKKNQFFSEQDLNIVSIFSKHLSISLSNFIVTQELHLAYQQEKAIIDSMDDGVIAFDRNYEIVALNQKAKQAFRLESEETKKYSLSDLPQLRNYRKIIMNGKDIANEMLSLGENSYVFNCRILKNSLGQSKGMIITIKESKQLQSMVQKFVGFKARYSLDDIVGESPLMMNAKELCKMASSSDSSVLITGESGTGKELFAQSIHNMSERKKGPFVAINCAAIPRELLESELFGYHKGAFTGAKEQGNPGKFELAENGTILLDEIGDMPLDMQVKLLRVLQEKSIVRLGGNRQIPVNIRLIATTHRNLENEVKNGKFREDLFWRLKVIHLKLPSLRERGDDVEILAKHFLTYYSNHMSKTVYQIANPLLLAMKKYEWPGNIRQLQHFIESEISLSQTNEKSISKIPEFMTSNTKTINSNKNGDFELAPLVEVEKKLFSMALEEFGGNISDAARFLKVSRGTFYNKIKKYDLID